MGIIPRQYVVMMPKKSSSTPSIAQGFSAITPEPNPRPPRFKAQLSILGEYGRFHFLSDARQTARRQPRHLP
jgi:hypothetical protein